MTAHPTADWTLQQLREVVGDEGVNRCLIHDRDRIFAKHLDDSIKALGIEVLGSPVASPKANAICERVIGTIRPECLDWLIPISEAHLRAILKEWVAHYNGATEDVVTALWGLAFRILRRSWRWLRNPGPDMDWRRVRSCSRNRYWGDYIMSIHS